MPAGLHLWNVRLVKCLSANKDRLVANAGREYMVRLGSKPNRSASTGIDGGSRRTCCHYVRYTRT